MIPIWVKIVCYYSVTKSCLTLWPLELQHARLSCPSLSPRVCTNSCPLNWWCHPTISSSVVPFSSCLQPFPASESFPRSQFFTSTGQSIGVSASAISPFNEYSGLISFRMDWLDLLAVQGPLKSLFQQHSSRASKSSVLSNSHIHRWLMEKNIALTRWTFVGKVMSLIFNMLSRLIIAFLPRSKSLLISWLKSPS